MNEIIKKISESLQIPLLIESNQDDMVQLVVTNEENVNNYNFITFLRGLIKYHLVEKIQYKKNNDKLHVSFSMIKHNLNNALIDKILDIIKDYPYLINEDIDYDIKSITTKLDILLLGLYSNSTIEYDVLNQIITFELESIDTKILSLPSSLNYIDELNNNPNLTKKFVNGGNCDYDIMYKITSPEEIQQAALAYSEGNNTLYKLLEFCFSNNIWTTSCCKGHKNKYDKYGFVTFNLNHRNTREFFGFLTNKLLCSSIDELLLSENNFNSVPNYPTCYLQAFNGIYTSGTINYQCNYVDQILQIVLKTGKEYVNVKKNTKLDNSLHHHKNI